MPPFIGCSGHNGSCYSYRLGYSAGRISHSVSRRNESPVNLKVAEKYVDASGNAAKQGNTLILPGNMADIGTTVAAAMRIDMTQK